MLHSTIDHSARNKWQTVSANSRARELEIVVDFVYQLTEKEQSKSRATIY